MSKKHGVRLEKLNWDETCKLDLLRGRGFVVSEPAITGYIKKLASVHRKMFEK